MNRCAVSAVLIAYSSVYVGAQLAANPHTVERTAGPPPNPCAPVATTTRLPLNPCTTNALALLVGASPSMSAGAQRPPSTSGAQDSLLHVVDDQSLQSQSLTASASHLAVPAQRLHVMEVGGSSVPTNGQREILSSTSLQKQTTTTAVYATSTVNTLRHGFLEASYRSGSSLSSEAKRSRESFLEAGTGHAASHVQDAQSQGDHESEAENLNQLDSASSRKEQSSSHFGAASNFRGNVKSALTHRRPADWIVFVCMMLALACLFAVVALLCACRGTSARAVDGTKVRPQSESSTSPLLFRGLTIESTISSEAADDKTGINSDATFLPDLPAGLVTAERAAQANDETREMPGMPVGVPLVWDTPFGERVVYATKKPLGVQFRAEFPLRVKREPEGHGKEIGVELGWILKRVNGMDVTGMTDIHRVNEILYREVGEKTVPVEQWNQKAMEEQWTRGIPLIWDTPKGRRIVYATKKPLGVQFRAEFPLKIKREPEGHGKEIGLQVGWVLIEVNGFDVTAMTDIHKVNEILYREVGEKTLPVEQWQK